MAQRKPGGRRRRSIRLPGYDYRSIGAYFVTICTHRRARLFGKIDGGVVHLSAIGHVVATEWHVIAQHHPTSIPNAWIVMPDHFHGILMLANTTGAPDIAHPVLDGKGTDIRRRLRPPPNGPPSQSLGAIIGSFKAATTRRINLRRRTPGMAVWQRGYDEHVIRSERALARIRTYIAQNPVQWRG